MVGKSKLVWPRWKAVWQFFIKLNIFSSKQIKNLEVRPKPTKYIEENISKTVHNTGFYAVLGYTILVAKKKTKISKWDYI